MNSRFSGRVLAHAKTAVVASGIGSGARRRRLDSPFITTAGGVNRLEVRVVVPDQKNRAYRQARTLSEAETIAWNASPDGRTQILSSVYLLALYSLERQIERKSETASAKIDPKKVQGYVSWNDLLKFRSDGLARIKELQAKVEAHTAASRAQDIPAMLEPEELKKVYDELNKLRRMIP